MIRVKKLAADDLLPLVIKVIVHDFLEQLELKAINKICRGK